VRHFAAVGAFLTGALVFAPLAFAQQPSSGLGAGGGVQGAVGGGAAGGGGSLPFTGLDLAFLVIGGLTLLAVGASLRRLSRARN
jgi:hypothetical protein